MPRQVGTNPTMFSSALGELTLPAWVDSNDPTSQFVNNVSAALSIDTHGRLRVVLSTGTGGVQQNITFIPASLTNSVSAVGSAAAPAAGAAIVTLAAGSLPAGTYDVSVTAWLSVAGTKNNMQVQVAAGVIGPIAHPSVVNDIPPSKLFRLTVSGAQAISVNAIALDAVGTYEAEIIATRIA